MRLTGPAPAATDGVRLAGRAVSANGKFVAPVPGEAAPVRRGVLAMTLNPSSAALVTVVPAHKKPARHHRKRKH